MDLKLQTKQSQTLSQRKRKWKKAIQRPLSGGKLAERGITLSRMTVAKYREEEEIPDASGRREYI